MQQRWGVRASPKRTAEGAPPLLGRLACESGNKPGDRQGLTKDRSRGEQAQSKSWWLFTGLGVRGLLYHGIMAERLVKAILTSNESHLDSVVRRWQRSG